MDRRKFTENPRRTECKLPCTNISGSKLALRRASEAYLPASWSDEDLPELLYGQFDEPEFIARAVPSDGAEKFRAFLADLGVASRVRTGLRRKVELSRYMLRSYGWLGDLPPQSLDPCDGDHAQVNRKLEWTSMDRFDELIHANRDTRKRLAELVAQLPSRADATIKCCHSAHRGTNQKPVTLPSEMAWRIANNSWLPALDPAGNLVDVRPGEAGSGPTRWPSGRCFQRPTSLTTSDCVSDAAIPAAQLCRPSVRHSNGSAPTGPTSRPHLQSCSVPSIG